MRKWLLLCSAILFLFSLHPNKSEAYFDERFSDLPYYEGHWAYEEIIYLNDQKIIKGYGDRTFRPNNHVSRSQAITMVVRALKLDLSNRPNPGFKDVSATNGNYREIAAAVDEGIYPKEERLYPNLPVTREVMARILANAFKLKGDNKSSFKDVTKKHWAYSYIDKLAANNITTGYSDQTFKPKNVVSRAQFSVFLARSLKDDYKTWTYSNPIGYKLNLPNYMKGKLVAENGNCDFEAALCTNFYYKDTTFYHDNIWMIGLYRFSEKHWKANPELQDIYMKASVKPGYVYAYLIMGEHGYVAEENRRPLLKEYIEWSKFQDRLRSSFIGMN